MDSNASKMRSPVADLDTQSEYKAPQDGMAVCLSGGGYRAMLFHVGALWRMNEAGLLPKLKRISSVSGGSITSAVLGMNWAKMGFNEKGEGVNFRSQVADPVRELAGRSIDAKAIFTGIFLPGTVSDKIVAAYDKHVFKGKTLQDLPDDFPRFVINATNVQSGALWRFMKPYMRDWRVGEIKNPKIPLAVAVAASSAFPPVLSPAHIELDPRDFTEGSGHDLEKKPYMNDVVLTDGGVYDNLGLETIWKRYKTIFVSDAGGKTQPEADPKHDWIGHLYRVFNLIDNQVRCLRKRQVISSFEAGDRAGAYWGIRSDISKYGLPDVLDCPPQKSIKLADVKTRLKRLDSTWQKKLINWGYAVCDAAIRKHGPEGIDKPKGFPYANIGIG